MKRELFVGVTFAVLLSLLLATTLWVNDPGFLDGGQGNFLVKASFRDVSGLQEGSEVWVYGTPGGRVRSIRPDGTGNVEVILALDADPQLRENAEVKLKARSALGGSVVAIHPGTPDHAPWSGGAFVGRSVSDPFAEISETFAENRAALKETIENARKITKDLADRSDRIATDLEAFSKNARLVSEDLVEGRGTLGKLLKDDSMHTELTDAIASVKKLAEEARTGGGTLDVLIHDKQLADDLRTSVEKVRSVATKLDAGEGTLGKLLNDPKPFDDLAAAAADIRSMTDAAKNGKGVLGKLIYDESLGARIDTITDDVADITGKIRRGEGTLGKLVNDDAVYTDLKAALKSLRAGSEDVRENAPILTFAGVLFGGF